MKSNEETALKAVQDFTLRRPQVWGNSVCVPSQRCNMMCGVHCKQSTLARIQMGFPTVLSRKKNQTKTKTRTQAGSKQLNLESQKKNTDVQLHPVCPATEEVSSGETGYGPKELSSAPSSLKASYGCKNSMHYWGDT